MELRRAVVAYRNRQALKDHRDLLEPGLWVFSGWELWMRAGRKVPKHLLYSKGNRRGPLPYRLTKAILSPLYWVVVPRKPGTSGDYIAMVKGPSIRREPIFFSDTEVLRVLRRPRDAEQACLRALWDEHVTNSSVVIEKTTDRYFVERVAPGGLTARMTETPALIEAFETMCGQYESLMRATDFGVLADYRDDIEPKLESSAKRDLIFAAIAAVGEEAFWSLPVVPVGSDASPDNAIIADGNIAYFVDTEPIYLRPVISHPLGVIGGWNHRRGDLVQMYLDGAFDDELEKLIPGVVESESLDRKTRMACLVLSVLVPGVTPKVIRRKMRPLDGLLSQYGIEDLARRTLLGR